MIDAPELNEEMTSTAQTPTEVEAIAEQVLQTVAQGNAASEKTPDEQRRISELTTELKGETLLRSPAQNDLDRITAERSANLARRVRGEITGVELDRLNALSDEQSRQNPIMRKVEEMRAKARGVGDTVKTPSAPSRVNISMDATRSAHDSMVRASEREKLHQVAEFTATSGVEASEQDKQFLFEINNSYDFRSLMSNLSKLGDIVHPEDGYVYKAEDTLNTIRSLKDSRDPNLERVTNTYGLREKVRKLLLRREAQ